MMNAGVRAMVSSLIIVLFSHLAYSDADAVKVVTPKKGIAMARFGPGNAALAGASWYYDWTNNPHSGTIPSGLQAPEFVPMIWGAGNVTDQNINALKAAKDNGTYKYLLGFNEPDMGGQANMTVAQAISLWPRLMETGLVLGSPAPSYTNAWFTDFMTQAAANNLRVDFICLHTYRPPNATGVVDDIKNWINDTYAKYQKPIWLTEFGAPDCNKLGWCGAAAPLTQAQVDDYTKQVIAMLEDLPCVQRYAWFVDASQAGFELSALFNSDGSLSETGTIFRDAQGTAVVRKSLESRGTICFSAPFFRKADGRIVCTLSSQQVNYRISFYTMAGRCLTSLQGSGSGKVVISPQQANFAKGIYIGRVETPVNTKQARFAVP